MAIKKGKSKQLSLFDSENKKRQKIAEILDKLHDKMGEGVVKRGSLL